MNFTAMRMAGQCKPEQEVGQLGCLCLSDAVERRHEASRNRASPGGVAADTAFGDAIALETHASAEARRKGTGGTGQGEANRRLQWC